jgi:hypothetical protein
VIASRPFVRRAGRGTRLLAARNDRRTLAALEPWLRPEDRRAGRRFAAGPRRRAHLLARALLRLALAERGRGRDRLALRRDRRPLHATPDRRRLTLSIAHGGDWVVVALGTGAATGRRIGIDIEARDRPIPPRLRERLPWGAATVADWTRTEAALKADGRGVPALGAIIGVGAPGFTARARMTRPPRHRIRVGPAPLRLPGAEVALAVALRTPGGSGA